MNNFAILDFQTSLIIDAIRFTVFTNYPCHLTCYWTLSEPQKHPLTRTVRGLTVPWYTRFCLVSWRTLEQDEAGDTLEHTFTWAEWPICQTRWFTFRGTVSGTLSPSVGPLFHYHPTERFTQVTFIPKTTDGYLHAGYLPTYLITHAAPTGDVRDWYSDIRAGQTKTFHIYHIYRACIFWDTSSLPIDAEIISAVISLFISVYIPKHDTYVLSGWNLHEPSEPEDYGYLRGVTEPRGILPAYPPNGYNDIQIYPRGLTEINRQGTTVFAFRSKDDIEAIPPPLREYGQWYAVEKGPDYASLLTVTYKTHQN